MNAMEKYLLTTQGESRVFIPNIRTQLVGIKA